MPVSLLHFGELHFPDPLAVLDALLKACDHFAPTDHGPVVCIAFDANGKAMLASQTNGLLDVVGPRGHVDGGLALQGSSLVHAGQDIQSGLDAGQWPRPLVVFCLQAVVVGKAVGCNV